MIEKLNTEMEPDTEIRKVSGRLMIGLVQILEPNSYWKKLMSEIRLDCFNLNDERYKYTHDDIETIAAASRQCNRPCAEIFFDEWGTSGRKRPTVRLLYDYLERIKFLRAADFIKRNFFNLPEIERPSDSSETEIDIKDISLQVPEPNDGSKNIYDSHHQRSTAECGEYILSNIVEYDESIKENVSNDTGDIREVERLLAPEILSSIDNLIDNSVERIPYEVLKTATRNFDENVKLGEGNFGTVYLGKLKEVDRAIKVLKNSAGVEHFERELIILSDDISHLRLLSPVGVSINEVLCLIYPYMSHRSLADRLAMKIKDLLPLGWQRRMMIADNVIEGLRYLHTRPKPIVHRDIKTSNILLDEADGAKIGDFGLVREKKESVTSKTKIIQGTDAYMAPETYRFQISTKSDVYSYGLVVLELLTGLPILDDNFGHLRDYVEEELEKEPKDINKLLDEKGDKWPSEIANKLYSIANNCLELDPKKRCDSDVVEENVKKLMDEMKIHENSRTSSSVEHTM